MSETNVEQMNEQPKVFRREQILHSDSSNTRDFLIDHNLGRGPRGGRFSSMGIAGDGEQEKNKYRHQETIASKFDDLLLYEV